jgi:integrase
MKRRLTAGFVKNPPLPAPPRSRVYYWDESPRGFGLMVTDKGHKSWVIECRYGGQARRITLSGVIPLDQARAKALEILSKAALGQDPAPKRSAQLAEPTFKEIANDYLRLEGKTLRSHDKYHRTLERLVYPAIGARPIRQIERYEITRMLDDIAETAPVMAKLTLAIIRRVMSWHATRDGRFTSPIVAGMAPRKATEGPRSRILSDNELRRVWTAAEACTGVLGPLIKFLLLTACRREEAGGMAWHELQDEIWIVPPERHKTGEKSGELVRPLSGAAMMIVNDMPRVHGSRYVFSASNRPFGNWSTAKERFDTECGVADWTWHDLRRTSRSLMSRAGVDSDIAERCLGHAIGGVRAVYDRHSFMTEKRLAFEKLAALINRIIDPDDNVIAYPTIAGNR